MSSSIILCFNEKTFLKENIKALQNCFLDYWKVKKGEEIRLRLRNIPSGHVNIFLVHNDPELSNKTIRGIKSKFKYLKTVAR